MRWLANHHRRGIPLPPPLEERLLARLSKNSLFAAWPLKELLRSRDGYAAFLERQWGCYLAAASGHPMAETEGGYLLPFGSDSELQDSLPGLVRVGLVEPVAVEQPDLLPGWASPALLLGPEGDARRLVGLLSEMERLAPGSPAEARWPLWQEIARVGSELARCVHGHRGGMAEEERERAGVLKTRLDGLFLEWLRLYYSPLSGQVLPTPHHLYHLPHYLAHQRRQGAVGKLALIILDGMSLAAWRMIRPAWAARHPTWRFQERLLLAELPSITPVSRRALVAGRRPADLSGGLGDNRREAREWARFWASQELPPEGSGYSPISPRSQEGLTAYPSDGHSLCLVYRGIDELAHGSTQGLAGMFAALEVWLERESHWLEGIIADLLSRGYALYLASDHGQTEGRGMGQPSEGILVETRSKRARLYDSRDRAMAVMATFPDTAMWAGDGLLPNGVSVLMAATGRAFAPFGELVVSHGGASLDEMVVPMVALSEEG